MNKLDEILETIKSNTALSKKEEKKNCTLLWVLAIIGAVAAIAGIAFAVYRYLKPSYLKDFEDDFEDDFDEEEDDFFEDEASVKEDSRK